MELRIALAGNPNCGKTTLFNALTGSNQYVGNWPGVTVEKKEGKLKNHDGVTIVDLPGIYSLSPYTLEEVVARNYLVGERPEAILNIIDGTNLERNLYLTTQLAELGIPVVAAINMMDIVQKNGDDIDIKALSNALGCVVVEISALKETGIQEAAEAAIEAARSGKTFHRHIFSGAVEHAIAHIEEAVVHELPEEQQRWYAVKLFERDKQVLEILDLPESVLNHIEKDINDVEEEMDDDAESIIIGQRYDHIETIIAGCYHKKQGRESVSAKIDRIVTNRYLALPIFAGIMLFIYAIAMGNLPISVGSMASEWAKNVLFGQWIPGFFDSALTSLGVSSWLYSMIMKGILPGVSTVLSFVPQLLVLFLMLSILEDCGYMSRVAFIMDRLFRRFGLSGKSFIPLLVATGCGVPGIMASRTIDQERDRRMTIITTGFIPCSAKLPMIALFAGAVFGGSALVAVSAFLIGIAAVIVSGVILKKFKAFSGDEAPFVMELPAYHAPVLKNTLRTTWDRGWSFVKRAGTVILLSSIVLWFLQSYGFVDGVFREVKNNNESMLAAIGSALAWIFYPLGWMGDMAWKATVASITGLIAKEEIVMTFGTLYNFAGELSESGNEIWGYVRQDFGAVTAYSFMVFNLLCAPCIGAIGAIRREMGNGKWTVFAIGYMTAFAYVTSMIIYQLGGLINGEATFNVFTVVAIAALAALIYLVVRKPSHVGNRLKAKV